MVKLKNWLCFSIIMLVIALPATACGVSTAGSNQPQPGTEQLTGANLPKPKLTELKPVSPGNGKKLQVVATTSIVGDIVGQVGGDKIDLTVLLPVGADPHTFEPTPRDLARVADAHVVFANGLGLERFLDEMLANAGGEAVVVPVSAGIEPPPLLGEGLGVGYFRGVNYV